MAEALHVELAGERLAAAQAALEAANVRLGTLPDDSDEGMHLACELITLEHAVMAAQRDVDLARGLASA